MRKYLNLIALTISALFLGACSDNKIITDPDKMTWVYSGEQIPEVGKPFKIKLDFIDGIYGGITYGIEPRSMYRSESKSFKWIMIDKRVYIYLHSDDSVYMEGKILEDKNQLEVSWEKSLGEYWDANAPENGWESTMILDLVSIENGDISSLWFPWCIPGYIEKYGIPDNIPYGK